MSDRSAAGLAALSLCESLLLALAENGIISLAEAKGILADAAATHRGAANAGTNVHAEAAALLEAIRLDGITASAAFNGDGTNPSAP